LIGDCLLRLAELFAPKTLCSEIMRSTARSYTNSLSGVTHV
jgi:hypothetical protein